MSVLITGLVGLVVGLGIGLLVGYSFWGKKIASIEKSLSAQIQRIEREKTVLAERLEEKDKIIKNLDAERRSKMDNRR